MPATAGEGQPWGEPGSFRPEVIDESGRRAAGVVNGDNTHRTSNNQGNALPLYTWRGTVSAVSYQRLLACIRIG